MLVVTLVALVLTLCIALPFLIKPKAGPTVKNHADADATMIQSLARMRAQQKHYSDAKASATKIQSQVRARAARKETAEERRKQTEAPTDRVALAGIQFVKPTMTRQKSWSPTTPREFFGQPPLQRQTSCPATLQEVGPAMPTEDASAAPEAEANSDSKELSNTEDQTAAEYVHRVTQGLAKMRTLPEIRERNSWYRGHETHRLAACRDAGALDSESIAKLDWETARKNYARLNEQDAWAAFAPTWFFAPNKTRGQLFPVDVPAIPSAAPEAEANSDSKELSNTEDQTAAEYAHPSVDQGLQGIQAAALTLAEDAQAAALQGLGKMQTLPKIRERAGTLDSESIAELRNFGVPKRKVELENARNHHWVQGIQAEALKLVASRPRDTRTAEEQAAAHDSGSQQILPHIDDRFLPHIVDELQKAADVQAACVDVELEETEQIDGDAFGIMA